MTESRLRHSERSKPFMNFTKTIREYCLQNKGGIFDISREFEDHFSACNKKTFYKILNRLEEEGVLIRKSQGIYTIVDDPNDRTGSGDRIIDWYTRDGHGVVVGYTYYNKMGISPHKDDKIVIYTNRIHKNTQNVGKHHLVHLDVSNFNKFTSNVILALELIKHKASIIDLDITKWDSVLNSLLMDFSGFFYEDVIMAKDYGYATICTLCDRLANKGHSGSLFMEMYLFHWGDNGVGNERRYIEVTPEVIKIG